MPPYCQFPMTLSMTPAAPVGGVQEPLAPAKWQLIGPARLPGEFLAAGSSLRVPVPGIDAGSVQAHDFGPHHVAVKCQAVRKPFVELQHSRVVSVIETRALIRYAGILWIDHNKVRRQAGVPQQPPTDWIGAGRRQRLGGIEKAGQTAGAVAGKVRECAGVLEQRLRSGKRGAVDGANAGESDTVEKLVEQRRVASLRGEDRCGRNPVLKNIDGVQAKVPGWCVVRLPT